MNRFEGGGDLTEALDREAEEFQRLQKRDFQPWHKPRKQLIRIRQWRDEMVKLLQELEGSLKARSLKYMSLPGDDLLDLRSYLDELENRGIRIQYLGYNSISKAKIRALASSVAENDIRSRGSVVADGSIILQDRFESISSERSIAYVQTRSMAPFDVINLDFCDSVLGCAPRTEPSTLTALHHVLDFQRHARSEPWLLFITTRVDRDSIETSTYNLLLTKLRENASKYKSFAEEMKTLLGVEIPSWPDQNSDVVLLPAQTVKCTSIALGKWIVGIMRAGVEKWNVYLLKSYFYSVSGREPDMMSLCFRFERVAAANRTDPMGLTSLGPTASFERPESDLATRYVKSIHMAVDVDELLARDSKLLKWLLTRQRAYWKRLTMM